MINYLKEANDRTLAEDDDLGLEEKQRNNRGGRIYKTGGRKDNRGGRKYKTGKRKYNRGGRKYKTGRRKYNRGREEI
jgi:hypothetical protein